MASQYGNLMDEEEIDFVPSSPDSDTGSTMTMEEEALKIADYISKRRAKMKPSLHSLTNLAHAGILKSSSTNLQSLSETPEQSPGMAEEPEDETVPTGDLLNLSPVRNKQKQRRATMVSQELQDMFGFEATSMVKPKFRQRKVTMKTPAKEEAVDKENSKPSTSTEPEEPKVENREMDIHQPAPSHEQVLEEFPTALHQTADEITTVQEIEPKIMTRSRARLSLQPDLTKVSTPKSDIKSTRAFTSTKKQPSATTKIKSSYSRPANVKSKIDTGRTPAKSAVSESARPVALSNRRLSLRKAASTVPQTPENKINPSATDRPSTAKKQITSRIDTGLGMRKSTHSSKISSKDTAMNKQFATPVQPSNTAQKRPASATIGQLATPKSAVPKRLQLARKAYSVQPKRTLPARGGSSHGFTMIEEASPPIEAADTPKPVPIKKPLFGTSAHTRGVVAGRRSLALPAGTKTTRLRAK